MPQTFTVDRADLKGWGFEAAVKDWIDAVCAWYIETHALPPVSIIQDTGGTIKVVIDPDLTEPDFSNFQTELDTLKSVSGTPGNWVFVHI